MPIFEYRCRKCRRNFERLILGSSAAGGVSCPNCNSRAVERIYSTFFGRTRTGDGIARGISSACSSCHASSCAGCQSR